MGYIHIPNLYKDQTILLFREVFALEKIHGTSAHVSWNGEQVHFFAGGVDNAKFVNLFDCWGLPNKFKELGKPTITVYGEAYGGKCQGMAKVYGKDLKFVAFEVKIGDLWLNVPDAEGVARSFGFDFVHYSQVSTDIETLGAHRDKVSIQAKKNGMGDNHPREGIVLRPLIELTKNNGERIIAKHKSEAYRETRTPRPITSDRLQVLAEGDSIAREWVTPMRLNHVLQSFSPGVGIEFTGDIIGAMVEDILREANQEIIDSKEARKSIGKRTATLFKEHLQHILLGAQGLLQQQG